MVDGQVDQHSLDVLVVRRAWFVVFIEFIVLKVHIRNGLLLSRHILITSFTIIIMTIALEPS